MIYAVVTLLLFLLGVSMLGAFLRQKRISKTHAISSTAKPRKLRRRRGKKVGQTSSWGLFYLPRVTTDAGIFAAEGEQDIFAEFFLSLARYTSWRTDLPVTADHPAIMRHPDTAINALVVDYGLVIIMIDHDKKPVCFSANYLNRLPPDFLERIRSKMRVMPSHIVLWADNVFKTPRACPAQEVIYGQRMEKPPT
jgi:hypothetical protein